MTWMPLNFPIDLDCLGLSTYPPPSQCLWPLRSAIAEEFDLTALEKDSKLGGQVQLGTWDLWQVTKTTQTKRWEIHGKIMGGRLEMMSVFSVIWADVF